jgi:hypothetical protein
MGRLKHDLNDIALQVRVCDVSELLIFYQKEIPIHFLCDSNLWKDLLAESFQTVI